MKRLKDSGSDLATMLFELFAMFYYHITQLQKVAKIFDWIKRQPYFILFVSYYPFSYFTSLSSQPFICS